ncbi:hypothetical protein O7630_34670 [Micromonospora sp. WMMD718]|uniref:hypothetical protein n=1 Tax=Micromonospora sp. WMMD718 TaxID=3016098 RepID=UPI002417B8CF|nr:hypothetical protein [Micromonospora sp. WMMD718]MDG4756036.1 hypothetical protein [Micromonospora sp. WMMD718]MDG4756090.1 hypothetical protein [Micromonospora sp. WMMD718]
MLDSRHPRRAVKVAAAVALLVVGLACDGEGTRSDRDPADRQVDPKRKQTVSIEASGDGPYSVVVRAAKAGDDRGDYTRKSVAGGAYRQTLDYTSGLRITITITATGHRTDPLSCEITDGTTRVRDRAAGTVQCKLTTSR